MRSLALAPGQGVCNTEFTDVATGTGATYVEALDDAIEQLATGGWDVDLLAAAEAMHPDADTIESDHGNAHLITL